MPDYVQGIGTTGQPAFVREPAGLAAPDSLQTCQRAEGSLGCLNILFVTAMYPSAERKGFGAFVMQQAEQLQQLGHHLDVFYFPGYRSRLEYIKAARTVWKMTRSRHYHIVHAHYGLAGLPALFRYRTPLVITLHGSDALLGRVVPFLSRLACRLADATIAVSRRIAQKIPGEVIPCGVDLDVFAPLDRAAARRRLGLSPAKKYVLFPFDPARKLKRYDLAEGALQRLRQQGLEAELLVVSQVHYTEMPWYYNAADAMILCSDSEASPTSVKEALACNLNLVSTDIGDVREITHGIDGVVLCQQNVEALAEGLRQVLNPKPGFKGRSAMQRYSQRHTAQAILRVYGKAMASHQNGSVLTPAVRNG